MDKEQLRAATIASLQQEPELLDAILNILSQSEEGSSVLQHIASVLQGGGEARQQQPDPTSYMADGGKIKYFVDCFAKGGSVGCNCGIAKKAIGGDIDGNTTKSTQPKQSKIAPWILRHKYVSQEYYPDGYVHVETAPTREMLTVNQAKDPNSEYNTAMGEYDGDHLIMYGGKDGIYGVKYGYSPVGNLHGADSTMAVNHIYNLLQQKGIKPGIPKKNASKD